MFLRLDPPPHGLLRKGSPSAAGRLSRRRGKRSEVTTSSRTAPTAFRREATLPCGNETDLAGCGSLLGVVIVDHQCCVDNSRNPTKQSEKNAQEKARNTSGQQHRQGRKHDAEKISQRLHLFAKPITVSSTGMLPVRLRPQAGSPLATQAGDLCHEKYRNAFISSSF
jgi:hypothetical protein